jgi:hypothetical protein
MLTTKQWNEYGPFWHLPKFSRKVTEYEKKIKKMMGSEKITLDSF